MSQSKQGLDFNLVMANTKTTKLIDNKNQIRDVFIDDTRCY